jgi:hypothetical protein
MNWLVKETIKGGLHLIPIRDEVGFKLNQLQFRHLQLSNTDKSSYSKWNRYTRLRKKGGLLWELSKYMVPQYGQIMEQEG